MANIMNNQNDFLQNNNENEITDEKLVRDFKNGDKNAIELLFKRYNEVVNIKMRKYFIIGAEREDIYQEGLIGLFKAIQGFDEEKQNSFKTFANMCIERQLITAVKTSTRQKHIPLNSSISLDRPAYNNEENDDTQAIEVFDSHMAEDPLETVTKREYYNQIENIIDENLSGFEKKVLSRFSKGESYNKIAEVLDAPVKSIDNAIQRIRKKTIKNINDINQNNL